jgi:hypothetical protein
MVLLGLYNPSESLYPNRQTMRPGRIDPTVLAVLAGQASIDTHPDAGLAPSDQAVSPLLHYDKSPLEKPWNMEDLLLSVRGGSDILGTSSGSAAHIPEPKGFRYSNFQDTQRLTVSGAGNPDQMASPSARRFSSPAASPTHDATAAQLSPPSSAAASESLALFGFNTSLEPPRPPPQEAPASAAIIPPRYLPSHLLYYSDLCDYLNPDFNMKTMDALYHSSFYDYLKDEENVITVARHLTNIVKDYNLKTVGNGLKWLIDGWKLESVAKLVKIITRDWLPDVSGMLVNIITRIFDKKSCTPKHCSWLRSWWRAKQQKHLQHLSSPLP